MRHHEFLSEDELFEIKMSPSNLQKLAGEIPDAKFGLEFELIVPNVDADDADEPGDADYDQDERCRSIDDIVDFFCNQGVGGDYNSERLLRIDLERAYNEWVDDYIERKWDRERSEFVRDWVENNTSVREEAENAYREDNPDADYDDVRDAGNDAVESAAEDSGNIDEAYEEFVEEERNGSDTTESDWLEDEGYRYMGHIEHRFDNTYWPYREENDGTDMHQVAASISSALGAMVKVGGYHDVDRRNQESDGFWILETDSSLDANNRNEAGLELVSPPLKLDAMKKAIGLVAEWADSVGAYTGKHNKTGLHMNVSVPGYRQSKLDFVKLALLLGDNHVLKEFDRMSYSYAKGSFDLLSTQVQAKPEAAERAIQSMKGHFDLAASRAIHSGSTDKYTSINVKDNRVEFRGPGGDYLQMFKTNPNKLFAPMMRFAVALDAAIDPEKYRDEYQKKLYKFLSKAVKGKGDLLSLFADYAAGKGFPQSAYKSFLKKRKADRDLVRNTKLDQPNDASPKYEIYTKDDGQVVTYEDGKPIQFNATSPDDATSKMEQILADFNIGNPRDYDVRGVLNVPAHTTTSSTGTEQRAWQILNQRTNLVVREFLARDRAHAVQKFQDFLLRAQQAGHNLNDYTLQLKGSDDGNTPAPTATGEPQAMASNGVPMWVIYRVSDGSVVHSFAEHPSEHSRTALSWLRDQGYENPTTTFRVRAMSQNEYPQARTNQSAVNTPPEGGTGEGLRGNWGFWMAGAARFARWGGTEDLRRFSSREAAEQWLADARRANPQMRTDIDVREIEPSQPTAQTPNWETVNDRTGQVVHRFYADNQNNAIAAQFDYLTSQGLTTDDFTLQSIERAPQAQQARQEPGRQFTGTWLVKDNDGRELYRFNGVGNNQADANRVAAQWAQRNMVSGEFDVVPEMA